MDKALNNTITSTIKGNKTILNIINIGLLLLFIVIVIAVYYLFVRIEKYTENFETITTIPASTIPITTKANLSVENAYMMSSNEYYKSKFHRCVESTNGC